MSDDEEQKSEFQFPVTSPFQIAAKGNVEDATFITFHAPTAKVIGECSSLKQAFFRAFTESGERNTSSETQADPDVEIFGHDVIDLLASSSNVDMPDVMDIAKKLFMAPGIALVNGEIKFGTAVVDRMSAEDFQNAVGEYLVFFVLASSLKRLKEKSSEQSQT